MKKNISALFLAGTLGFYSLYAQADESLDDLLGAFDDHSLADELLDSLPEAGTIPDSSLIDGLTGSMAISTAYNYLNHESTNGTDWQGLSKLRARLNLQYDQSFNKKWEMRASGYTFYDSVYALRDRNDYSNQVLSDYEKEAEIQELWIRGKLRSNLDIKIGRQVVNWGRADSLRVLDILNPLDNREPGLADIEDLRLPLTMIKTDYFIDDHWNSSFIVIPEVRFSKNAPYGSDYWVYSPGFEENKPENVSDSSYAASINGIFSGWDISFHAARIWRDAPYLSPVFTPGPTPLAGSSYEHSRVNFYGLGGNYTKGAWLLKSELGYYNGIDYTIFTDQGIFGVLPTSTETKDRLDVLTGIEYFGISNTSFALELAYQYIPSYKNEMKPGNAESDTTALAFTATHSMLNDRLDLKAVFFGNFGNAGGGYRFDAEYDLIDALTLSGGIIFYKKGEALPFDTYYNNDRIFAELKYSF